ncbi:MAG: type II toxin-antitoxin system RelB/DinJ family antitoxin [Desulfovibrio sp.]|nr:type II toxin-antitoxin system RelB/DinJ family antitoxin [Desulfovibrio sp.]
MVNLQLSVEESLRDKAQAVAEDIGIDLERAIYLFLTLMVQKNDLPFQKEDDPFYSPQNQAHLREIFDDFKHNRNFAPHELIEDEDAHLAQ